MRKPSVGQRARPSASAEAIPRRSLLELIRIGAGVVCEPLGSGEIPVMKIGVFLQELSSIAICALLFYAVIT